MRSRVGRSAAVVASATILVACGGTVSTPDSTATGSVQVDVGTMKVAVDRPIRLAVTLPGTDNSYRQAQIKAVREEVAKIPGAEVTVLDGTSDPMTQFDELQGIVESGSYNALLLSSLDSDLDCTIATEDAPERGVVVVALMTALCGRTVNEGLGLWAPGTLSYIGGLDTTEYWHRYLEYIVAQNPGPQKALVLAGPRNTGSTINLQAALRKLATEHPEFQVVQTAYTDYSIPQGKTKTVPMLRAHPKATILLCAHATLTRGAMKAIRGAGRTGRLTVYDKGASAWSLKQLRAGRIMASSPEYPVTAMRTAVQVVADAFDGKPVERFFLNSGAPLPADADPTVGFFLVTKENAGSFEAGS